MQDMIVSPRGAARAVDWPFALGTHEGAYELASGKRRGMGMLGKSPWAYACMVIRSSELARLPWAIVSATSGEIVESHPLYDMLKSFGQESNYADAMALTEIDMLTQAAGYWLIDGNVLQRLDATTIDVKADRNGISEFTQTIDGTVVNRFPREAIVYFREPDNEVDLIPGTAPWTVAKLAIDQEYEANRYVKAYFANDATPALLLTTEQDVGDKGIKEILTWWNHLFRGPKNRGKTAAVDRGMKAQQLAADMGDQALVEIRDQAREDICVVFGVPKILAGSLLESTYANASEARKYLLEDKIIPRGEYYAGVINHDLVERFDPSVRFEFQTDELPIFQEDATSKWERLSGAITQQVISADFARQEMGWPLEAAPAVQPEQPMTPEQRALRAWRRKVQKHNDGNVEFVTDDISVSRQAAIRALLAAGKIDEAFA